ncbi:MAG: hypothetical protein H6Q67_2432 [Firmicutes bacterium]|nr:hypothetical protein [Bacillota bacterium]
MGKAEREKGKRGEEWRPVAGYENLYEVSNLGRIRSLKRATTSGKIIIDYVNTRNGYSYTCLCKENKKHSFRIHVLVANAFLPKEMGKNQVNHKNGDKNDNRVVNLEWCSQSENMKHAYKLGLEKITWEKKVIRLPDKVVFNSMKHAAASVNGQQSKITLCCQGKRKHHRGYAWSYFTEDKNHG